VSGPLAWLASVWMGTASHRIFPLVVVGDLAWWLPLAYYLMRQWEWRRVAVAWAGAALHLVACTGLLMVAQGAETNPEIASRQVWILSHTPLWVTVWTMWTLASISLLAFVLVWSKTMRRHRANRTLLFSACAAIAVGVLFDLSGETTLAICATQQGAPLQHFAASIRQYQWLSAAVANGLYCAAGMALTREAWRCGQLNLLLTLWGYTMWLTGMLLTVGAVFQLEWLMIAAGAGVMILFTPWKIVTGYTLRVEKQ